MKLNISEIKTFKVFSEDYYSRLYLDVMKGEVYSFESAKSPKWIDAFIPCSADGYWNPILLNSKKRVKNTKCFKLCGTIDKNEEGHFVIGSKLENYKIEKGGNLYFFANDHYATKYYENNHGFIVLTVARIS